ncbi:hypothetical protein NE237_002373 [Protea cynaroides]|uniref:non-specific serine/threonine protein kinase n=1 Tax=Protea cynaroides TaxID=273540 RepID=A0A9Q0KV47_9MAGN|nr:hypothetical protein NE237_002373 [Protea cynaroides]
MVGLFNKVQLCLFSRLTAFLRQPTKAGLAFSPSFPKEVDLMVVENGKKTSAKKKSLPARRKISGHRLLLTLVWRSQLASWLENNSRTVKGANNIGQDDKGLVQILLPLKTWSKGSPSSCEDQDAIRINQSLRILLNLIAAGAIHSSVVVDEVISELLRFTAVIVGLKLSDNNELVTEAPSILKKLLNNTEIGIGKSYCRHWISLVELYSQIVGCSEYTSGRILYESTACLVVILSRVAEGHRTSVKVSLPPLVDETLKQIVHHAKTFGVLDLLFLCLAASGLSLMSGATNVLCSACEAWWLSGV